MWWTHAFGWVKSRDGRKELSPIGARELRGKLTRYLRLACESTTILVTSRNEVVAEITPPRPEILLPREPGALRGRIWMAEDFDTWPDHVLASFESGDF